MDTSSLIAQIDFEISRLQQARALLNGSATTQVPTKRKPGRPPKPIAEGKKKTRTFSAEGLARIKAAQKKRWAAVKKAEKN